MKNVSWKCYHRYKIFGIFGRSPEVHSQVCLSEMVY